MIQIVTIDTPTLGDRSYLAHDGPSRSWWTRSATPTGDARRRRGRSTHHPRAAALASRTGNIHLRATVILPFVIAALAGSLAGGRVTEILPAAILKKAFAALLIVVGCYVALRSGSALAT